MARKFGVHRRLVRKALADAVPRQRRASERTMESLLTLAVDVLGKYATQAVETR